MFLGDKKILSTHEEGGYIFVKFEDGTEDKFSKAQFDATNSEEAMDASAFRLKRCLFLEEEIYKLLLTHNVNITDVGLICQRLPQSVQENYINAVNQLWGKNQEQQKTLWEAHEILAKAPSKTKEIPNETT